VLYYGAMEWRDLLVILSWLYAIVNTLLALFSFNMLFLLILAVWQRRPRPPAPAPDEAQWPTVLVQLPIYNERYVVERLIDAAVALDYPSDRLIVQVLDDSTDDTTLLGQARAAYHRQRGRAVEYIHRTERSGYKAGALAAGQAAAPGEFIVVFDADFVPPPDFLRRMIPEFVADPRLGILQARWEHLNVTQSAVTRVIALLLDMHFAVEQVARSRTGMLMNFNGSAGVIRRACLADAGGWQHETLVEDLDLAYRAQLRGWRVDYRPDVTAPAELPASIQAFKLQQFRWSKGSIQVLRKLGWQVITSRRPLLHKIEGILHLSAYMPHPLILLSLLLSLPVVMLYGYTPLNWALLGAAALIPPLAVLWSQLRLRRDWLRRWSHYPLLFLVGIGLAVNNSIAMWQAATGRASAFMRTPKFSGGDQRKSAYALRVDWTTYVELGLAVYGLGTALLALQRAPALVPFILMYAAGFGVTAALSFWQSGGVRRAQLQRRERTGRKPTRANSRCS